VSHFKLILNIQQGNFIARFQSGYDESAGYISHDARGFEQDFDGHGGFSIYWECLKISKTHGIIEGSSQGNSSEDRNLISLFENRRL
jgi:hypothetical protein